MDNMDSAAGEESASTHQDNLPALADVYNGAYETDAEDSDDDDDSIDSTEEASFVDEDEDEEDLEGEYAQHEIICSLVLISP
jgi:hypothetical protein